MKVTINDLSFVMSLRASASHRSSTSMLTEVSTHVLSLQSDREVGLPSISKNEASRVNAKVTGGD
jgi:hypothetical protein